MKFLIATAVLVFCATITVGEKARFDNYKVHTLKVTTDEQLSFLQKLEEENSYMFWSAPTSKNDIDIIVPPHKLPEFEDLVKYLKVESSLKIENIQK